MTAHGKPMTVGWKVSTLASNIASVRYRAVIPIIALESTDVRNRLFRSSLEADLDGLDVLVIVKTFTPEDLHLAQIADARGIRVVFDLCDNIFIGDYASKASAVTPAQIFLSIAGHCRCVVTTTEPLAAAVREHAPNVPVVVIPDGIESAGLSKRVVKVLREARAYEKAHKLRLMRLRVRNAVRRVRTEGVGVIPSLVGFVARRVGAAVTARVRRRPHGAGAGPESGAQALPGLATSDGRSGGPRRIVWFGNHGAEHARFGMLDILEYRQALETIAAEQQVELVVISNNYPKYQEHIQPLAIPTRYVEWSTHAVEAALKGAAAVIVPNTLDPFSICKSANRTVLALAHGVPVVATLTPALQLLSAFIHTGDPAEGLRKVLADPEGARSVALEGYRHAEDLFGMKSIQTQWLRLLRELPEVDPAAAMSQPYLAVVLNLVQDLDLALPILKEAQRAGVTCEAWASADLFKKSPRVLAAFKKEDIGFRVLPGVEALVNFSFPQRTRALLTVTETNLGPHRVPRLLSEAAIRQGLLVATMQHGFENVGLTYDEPLQSLDKVNIAAQRIYTWGPVHTLHPRVGAGVRARCVPVGCPKESRVAAEGVAELLPAGRPVVGIFENLHWHRYSDDYKAAFLANVQALSETFPEVLFVVKPHHAGLWLTKRYEGEKPAGDNVLIADPNSPQWEHHTAAALMARMDAVITSPSTVALDAARMDLPVAVVSGELYLENYLPLTLLARRDDWIAFVRQALDGAGRTALLEQSARFISLVLTPGDAARRIVEDLRATAGA